MPSFVVTLRIKCPTESVLLHQYTTESLALACICIQSQNFTVISAISEYSQYTFTLIMFPSSHTSIMKTHFAAIANITLSPLSNLLEQLNPSVSFFFPVVLLLFFPQIFGLSPRYTILPLLPSLCMFVLAIHSQLPC